MTVEITHDYFVLYNSVRTDTTMTKIRKKRIYKNESPLPLTGNQFHAEYGHDTVQTVLYSSIH